LPHAASAWRERSNIPIGGSSVSRPRHEHGLPDDHQRHLRNRAIAVRIDLIEREGEGAARLQFFLPVGLYLQAGVKITVDQGTPHQFPYVWCLTNTCIAADLADPKLIAEMESGQRLLLEVVDSSVLTVSTSLPLDKFAAVRQGTPTQVFEQAIDE
jgi:invasion protein IalB